MHSASLKRGRLTARLGGLDTLPGGSDDLKKLILHKDELLAKLCKQYEGLIKLSDEKKKRLEVEKKKLSAAKTRAEELVQNRRKMEAGVRNLGPSPERNRKKRNAAEQEHENLHSRIEKRRSRLESLTRKYRTEQDEAARRKTQLGRREAEEKELMEAAEKDEREAQDLENYISRLSETLFERQRKYEEMLIGEQHDLSRLSGIEKSLREDRRRLLRDRQQVEEYLLKEEAGEEPREWREKVEVNLDEISSQWLKTNNEVLWYYTDAIFNLGPLEKCIRVVPKLPFSSCKELLLSDVKVSEQGAIGTALSTRISQLEAVLRLLRMKKDPMMYSAFSRKEDGSGVKDKKVQRQMEQDVKIPDFRRKIKEFIQREQAVNKAFLGDGNQDVDSSYWENLEEVKRETAKRKLMVQQGEEWARKKLAEEIASKMRAVGQFEHEVEAMESRTLRLKKELQVKKQEIWNEEKKKEAAERRRRQRKQEQEQARARDDSFRRQKVETHQINLAELREKRQEAETKRRQIRSDITSTEREVTDMKARLHAFRVHQTDDTPELQKTKEALQARAEELQGLEAELRKMLSDATKSNQGAKEQLAVVKPYQLEQQEMDYLLDHEKQLDRQLREAHRQLEAEHSYPQIFHKMK